MTYRLGKVEKWVLKHCYLKQIDQVPDGWVYGMGIRISPYPDDFAYFPELFTGLTKIEVLINYFHLPRRAYGRGWFAGIGYFPGAYDYEQERQRNKAMVSFDRVSKSLTRKGLVTVSKYQDTCLIQLTEQGMEKVKTSKT